VQNLMDELWEKEE